MNQMKRVKFAIGERVRIMFTNNERPFATVVGIIARPWMVWGQEALQIQLNKWSRYFNVPPEQLAGEFCYLLQFDEARTPFSKQELAELEPNMADYERQEILDNAKTHLVCCIERDLEHASNIIPDAI